MCVSVPVPAAGLPLSIVPDGICLLARRGVQLSSCLGACDARHYLSLCSYPLRGIKELQPILQYVLTASESDASAPEPNSVVVAVIHSPPPLDCEEAPPKAPPQGPAGGARREGQHVFRKLFFPSQLLYLRTSFLFPSHLY